MRNSHFITGVDSHNHHAVKIQTHFIIIKTNQCPHSARLNEVHGVRALHAPELGSVRNTEDKGEEEEEKEEKEEQKEEKEEKEGEDEEEDEEEDGRKKKM